MDMIAAWIELHRRRHAARPFGDGALGRAQDPRADPRAAAVPPRRGRGHEEALRRALAIQAMPQNLARTLTIGWHSADLMWRLAGDTATDYNHYTKRAILMGIYSATLAVRSRTRATARPRPARSSIGGSTG
jgi:ubiquinone biosynthesis protein COQ9